MDLDNLDLDADFSMVNDNPSTKVEICNNNPEGWRSMGDPDWSDFVLSQLTKDELRDGNPTFDGLQRMAAKLFGTMNILPLKVHHCNEAYAAVTATIEFPEVHAHKVVSASADAHNNNTDAPFSQYVLAMAETRAISRALRFALQLKKVVVAEELSRKANISIPIDDSSRELGDATGTQIKFIELMCKKQNISVKWFVESVVGPHEKLSELTYSEASCVQEALEKRAEKIEQGKQEEETGVEVFDNNWKNNF